MQSLNGFLNPWTFIGWLVIGLLAVGVFLIACWIIFFIFAHIWRLRLHYRTRNIPPAVGQVWLQDDGKLYIDVIYESGVIGIRTAPTGYRGTHASWGDTPEAWKRRVRNRKLVLLEETCNP